MFTSARTLLIQGGGGAIFFNNDFEFTVHKNIIDDTGNFIAIDLTIENQRLSLISILAAEL